MMNLKKKGNTARLARLVSLGRRLVSLALCAVMFISLAPVGYASNIREETTKDLADMILKFYDQAESGRKSMVSDLLDHGQVSDDPVYPQIFPNAITYLEEHKELFAAGSYIYTEICGLKGQTPGTFVTANGNSTQTIPLIGEYYRYYLLQWGNRWWDGVSETKRQEFLMDCAKSVSGSVDTILQDNELIVLKVPKDYYSLSERVTNRPSSDLDHVLVELSDGDRAEFVKYVDQFSNGEELRKKIQADAHMGLDENTYLLRVGTGVAPGDNVQYLGVRYRDTTGVERTEFLFPHEGSLSEGYRLAEQYGSPKARLNAVKNATGYSPANSYEATEGLQKFSDDTYLFQTHYAMEECLGVDVLLRYPMDGKGSTSWNCTGMYLYHVEDLYGVDMAGYYSSSYYISFKGKLLMKLASDKGLDLTLNRSDRLFRLGREVDADMQMVAVNENSYPELMNYDSQASEYLFKLDLADVYEGGIEALTAFYNDGESVRYPIEALTMNVSYTDIYGKKRTVNMPMITSMIGWLVENGILDTDLHISGFAQQGESILFPASLPDFKEFGSITLTFGNGAAAAASVSYTGGTSVRKTRENMLANETISITGIQIYPGDVKATASIEPREVKEPATGGAALRLTVDNSYAPIQYFVWGDADGYRLKSGATNLTDRFTNYKPGDQLNPTKNTERNYYMVEIDTDDIERAGTLSSLYLRLGYISKTTNSEAMTPALDLKEATRDYYGYWPGESGDVAYRAGAGAGGTLVCSVSADDVSKFTSATLSMDSHSTDDWQMKAIRIYKGGDLGDRMIVWENTGFSDRRITRNVDESTRTLIATYPNALDGSTVIKRETENETEETNSEEQDPGEYLPKEADKLYLGGTIFTKTIYFGENSKSAIEERKPIDWSGLRYSMTYKDAMQDLGFDNMDSTYRVDVKVAGNEEADGESGDCGSKNLFYFKLVFEGGSSGYVLANQQLSADGFRADRIESFYISTNRDYGALESVSIIPEDDSGSDNQDPFDKLKISYINVTKETADGLAKTWRVDNVGWIDVNYRDKSAENTVGGRIGRTESELAAIRARTGEGYSLNLMIGMTTGSYQRSEDDVNRWASEENPQFRGSMVATVEYYDHDDILRRQSIDVVRAMYDYASIKPQYYEETFRTADGESETRAKSDPNFMFRAGHTDWFFINLPDVKQILRIRLGASSEVATVWNLSSLSIYTIEEKGSLQLTAWDEYKYNGVHKRLCTSTDVIGYPLQVFAPENALETLGEEQEIPVLMGEHEISIETSGGNWTSSITEEPVSQNDTVNVYVYMKDGDGETPLDDYDMKANLCWQTCIGTASDRMDPIVVMDKLENKETHTRMFYYTGLHTAGLTKINQLMVKTHGPQLNQAHVDYAVVQHVRSGVVIDTWYMDFGGRSAENGAEVMYWDTDQSWRPETMKETRQVVKMFVSPDLAEPIKLVKDSRDVAVSIRYNTANDVMLAEANPNALNATTYNSRNVFLSKYYSEITPGMILEIPFAEEGLEQINGLTVATMGNVELPVESAYAAVYDKNNTCMKWVNFADGDDVGRTPVTLTPTVNKTVVPVKIIFKNGSGAVISSATETDGTPAPIRMRVTYINGLTNQVEELIIPDINAYLTRGSFLVKEDDTEDKDNGIAEIQFFMKNAATLRYLTLEPYAETPGETGIWSLHEVYCEQNIKGQVKSSTKVYTDVNNQPTNLIEGAPLAVNISTIGVQLSAESYNESTKVSTNVETDIGNTGNVGISIPSGNSVTITPTLIGALNGKDFQVSAVRSVVTTTMSALGRAETTVATENVECYTTENGKVTFTPPENTGTESVTYIVTIRSGELPAAFASIPVVVMPAPVKPAPEEREIEPEEKEETDEPEKDAPAEEPSEPAENENSGGEASENP